MRIHLAFALVCLFAASLAAETVKYQTPMEYDPSVGLMRVDNYPGCAEPVWIHPFHAAVDSLNRSSSQASEILVAKNVGPGAYVDIKIVSGSINRPHFFVKKWVDAEGKTQKTRYKFPSGTTRTVVKNLCPGASVVLFERRYGDGIVPVFFEANAVVEGSDGVSYTYTAISQTVYLQINWGWYWSNGQENTVGHWEIVVDQDGTPQVPNEFRSDTHYVSRDGVIRPK